jgi:hypothetical protein
MYDNESGQLYDVGSDEMTLLEGIGEESLDNGINLVKFEAKSIDNSWTTPESNTDNGSSSDSSSGGSSSYISMVFLFGFWRLRQVKFKTKFQ